MRDKTRDMFALTAQSIIGIQEETPSLDAMPMTVLHHSWRHCVTPRVQGDDVAFTLDLARMEEYIRESHVRDLQPYPINPYGLRDSFFAMRKQHEAIPLLETAWPFLDDSHTPLWSEMLTWQRMFVRLCEKANAPKQEVLAILREYGPRLGSAYELRSRNNLAELERLLLDATDDIEVRQFWISSQQRDMEQQLRWFPEKVLFALDPRHKDGNSIHVRTNDAGEKLLVIEVRSIVEAIGATIYMDRMNGVRHKKCKHCGRIFTVTAGRQDYCPP